MEIGLNLDADELPTLEWGDDICTPRVGFDNKQFRLNSVGDLAWQEELGVWHSEFSRLSGKLEDTHNGRETPILVDSQMCEEIEAKVRKTAAERGMGYEEARCLLLTKFALVRERQTELDFFPIVFANKMWREEVPETPEFSIEADTLPSLEEWAAGSSGGLEAAGWEGDGLPWPAGVKHDATMWQMSWAFIRFGWHYKRHAARIPLMLDVLKNLMPAISAWFMSRIIDHVNGKPCHFIFDECSPGDRSCHHDQLIALVVFNVICMLLKLAFSYKFQEMVPLSSLELKIEQIVMRQLLRLHGSHAKRMPPGACSSMLSYNIHNTVYTLWKSVFDAVGQLTVIVASFTLIGVGSNDMEVDGSTVWVIIALLMGVVMPVPFWYYLRRPIIEDMQGRQTKWESNLTSTAVEKIARARRQYSDRTSLTGEEHAAFLKETEQSAIEYANTSDVKRMRGLHSYFMEIVLISQAETFNGLLFAVLIVVTGIAVLDGSIQLGDFTLLTAAMVQLMASMTATLEILKNLPLGYANLVRIAAVINLKACKDCNAHCKKHCSSKADVEYTGFDDNKLDIHVNKQVFAEDSPDKADTDNAIWKFNQGLG